MKLIVVAFSLVISLLGCQTKAKENEKSANSDINHTQHVHHTSYEQHAQHKPNSTTKMKIEGMACKMACANKIEKNLNNTEGVSKAVVNFEEGIATIEFDKSKITKEELVDIVIKSGKYTVDINVAADDKEVQ